MGPGARIRRLGIDQTRSTCSTRFSGVATLANAVEHVGVTDRNCHLDLVARIDFRGVENGVDQALAGASGNVACLDTEGRTSRTFDYLDVSGGHSSSIFVMNDLCAGLKMISHRSYLQVD
jgi:hypothetical protein